MAPNEIHLVIAVLYTLVLIAAAVSDIRRRIIPNWTIVVLLILFAALAITDGGKHLVSALEAGGIALAVTVALYAFRIVGAGDSKLFTALALFAGLGFLPLLAVVTTFTGGIVALAAIASRPTKALVLIQTRGKGGLGKGVPYGLAIAAGGAVIMWAPMADLVRPLGAPAEVTAKDISQGLLRPGAPH